MNNIEQTISKMKYKNQSFRYVCNLRKSKTDDTNDRSGMLWPCCIGDDENDEYDDDNDNDDVENL